VSNFNCGKLFLTGISGTSLKKEERDFIKDNNISGVVLFSENYENKKQLSSLIENIQSISSERKIIAVDQEGGRVQRFKNQFTIISSAQEIANSKSPAKCYEIFSVVANELHEVGVNLNFAPCVDILTNPECKVIGDRSFGSNVDVVSKFVSAAIRGLQKNNIMACAKHFPGHGDTFVDSHIDLPRSVRSFELLKKEDIEVFKVAFKNKVAFTMMAHLLIPDLDPEFPVSLSKKAHNFLIEELDYRGLIISDDMEMGAITKNYGAIDSAELALRAGTHLVEYRSLEACRDVVNGLNKKCEANKDLENSLKGRARELSEYLKNFNL
jgi:beta-N-acetylhexosaminidase